jgi:hypothetical protein
MEKAVEVLEVCGVVHDLWGSEDFRLFGNSNLERFKVVDCAMKGC